MSFCKTVCVSLYHKLSLDLSEQVSVSPLSHFRLANLSCFADPEDLLVYKDSETFGVIQNIILNCTRDKHSLSSRLVGTEKVFIPSLL